MNTWKVANAVVRHLEGDVRITPGVRTYEDGLQLLEDLDAGFDVRQVACSRTLAIELRVRDDVGGWAW